MREIVGIPTRHEYCYMTHKLTIVTIHDIDTSLYVVKLTINIVHMFTVTVQ